MAPASSIVLSGCFTPPAPPRNTHTKHQPRFALLRPAPPHPVVFMSLYLHFTVPQHCAAFGMHRRDAAVQDKRNCRPDALVFFQDGGGRAATPSATAPVTKAAVAASKKVI